MRYIDGEELNARLDFVALVDALQEAHRLEPPLRASALLEHETVAGTKDGFYVLPAWQPGEAYGAKIITMHCTSILLVAPIQTL